MLVHTLVKNLSDAPENWSYFTVEIQGEASEFIKKIIVIVPNDILLLLIKF